MVNYKIQMLKGNYDLNMININKENYDLNYQFPKRTA